MSVARPLDANVLGSIRRHTANGGGLAPPVLIGWRGDQRAVPLRRGPAPFHCAAGVVPRRPRRFAALCASL